MHHANLAAHIGAGALGLAFGLVALLATKGSRVHVRAGRLFVWVAALVVATAVLGILLFGTFPALSAATLAVGYQVTSGVRTIKRRTLGPAAIDNVLAAVTLAAAAVMIVTMGRGNTSWSPAIGYPILGTVSVVCLFDLSRAYWRGAWVRHGWQLDHAVKMTNSFFAMLGAGMGNLLPQFQPWTQVGPSMLGGVVLVVVVIVYRPRLRAARDDA